MVTETDLFESGAHSSLLEFCLWRWTKGETYKRNVDTRDELFFGILDATASIQNVKMNSVNNKLQLTVSNLSVLNSQTLSICRFRQFYLGIQSELDTCSCEVFSHNDRYHLPKYWTFLLYHPLRTTWCTIKKTTLWISSDPHGKYRLLH